MSPLGFSDDQFAEKFFAMCEDIATIKEQTSDLPALKAKVERHDRIFQYGKWTALPIIAIFQLAFKYTMHKLGF